MSKEFFYDIMEGWWLIESHKCVGQWQKIECGTLMLQLDIVNGVTLVLKMTIHLCWNWCEEADWSCSLVSLLLTKQWFGQPVIKDRWQCSMIHDYSAICCLAWRKMHSICHRKRTILSILSFNCLEVWEGIRRSTVLCYWFIKNYSHRILYSLANKKWCGLFAKNITVQPDISIIYLFYEVH